jgi:hypothetical protein
MRRLLREFVWSDACCEYLERADGPARTHPFDHTARLSKKVNAAAGLIKSAMTVSDIVDLIDARAELPTPRGKYKPRQPKRAAVAA